MGKPGRHLDQDQKAKLQEQPVAFVPIGELKTDAIMTGLELPDGTQLLFTNAPSGLVTKLWADQLNARIFVVRGKMTFTPDPETVKYSVR